MPAALAGAIGTAAASAAGVGAAGAGLIGAGVSAAGSLIGGALQSGSVSGGASDANAISQAAINQADQLRQQNSATFQPFVDEGTSGVTSLGNLLGVNGSDAASKALSSFQGSPGFSYALQQGERGVDAGAAAAGMVRSGATLKAEQTLGTNLADQNFNTYVGQLQGLAGLGITGAQGQAGTTATFNSLLNPQATNQASATYGAGVNNASIYGNTVNGLAGGINSTGGINGLLAGTSYSNFGGAGIGGTAPGSYVTPGGSSTNSLFNTAF